MSEPIIQNLTLNWHLVNNQETDFATVQEQPNKLYLLAAKRGRIRIAVPKFHEETKQITYFDAYCGLNGIISPSEIIAYAAFDLPEFVLKKVDMPAQSLLKQIYPKDFAFESGKFDTEMLKRQIQERIDRRKEQ